MTCTVPARLVADQQVAKWKPTAPSGLPPLAPIDWPSIGLVGPTLLNTPESITGVAADVVVIMWADSEWAPIHHIFCKSSASMPYSSPAPESYPGWIRDDADGRKWGEYRLVQVGDRRVLLYKSNIHYAYQGAAALTSLIRRLINLQTKTPLILSTGTAGGANSHDHVGTVVIVNSAALWDQSKAPSEWPQYSRTWHPSTSRLASIEALLVPIPVTNDGLTYLVQQFDEHTNSDDSLDELDPLQLNHADIKPQIHDLTGAGTALLTANEFLVGTTENKLDSYACVEMDDAIIAAECQKESILYGSVRNLSDPAQPPVLGRTGGAWGSCVYDVYGFYTSYNGALAAWAAIG